MPMRIPHDALQPDTLRAVVEEFVTRDGTNLADADAKLDQVYRQLRAGHVVLVYDEEAETCTLVRKEDARGL